MLHYKILPFIDPEMIFVNIANAPGVMFLDSNQIDRHYGRYSFILLNPLHQYIAANSFIHSDLALWNALITKNKTSYDPALPPFTGGLAGFFSYDLSKQLETILHSTKSSVPDYYLGLYNQVIAFDHVLQQCYLMVTEVDGFKIDYTAQLDNLVKLYNEAKAPDNIISMPLVDLRSNFSKLEYIAKVEQAIEHILAGDIFEVNLSQKFSGMINSDYPIDLLYRKLRRVNPAPFSAYANLGQLKVLSASPERFLSIRQGHIETRPIKGTCKRSNDSIEDKHLADKLRKSSKDRAENIMIVDLMRNDLAKICIPQSIRVSQLCGIESFTNLHHLVSVIEGDLKPDASIFDVIPACFPGGSITGAPKIRAMQIIEEQECIGRGVYCGSIGYFGFNGNVDLSIAIRTIVCQENELSFNVGGAITLESDPEDEYNETLIKSQKLIEAINS